MQRNLLDSSFQSKLVILIQPEQTLGIGWKILEDYSWANCYNSKKPEFFGDFGGDSLNLTSAYLGSACLSSSSTPKFNSEFTPQKLPKPNRKGSSPNTPFLRGYVKLWGSVRVFSIRDPESSTCHGCFNDAQITCFGTCKNALCCAHCPST